MKVEININHQELVSEIAQAVVKALKPLLSKGEGDVILDKKELAKYLRVNVRWVDDHFNSLPNFKIGRFPRFRKRDVDKWLETQRTPAINPISRSLQLIKIPER